MSCNDLAVEFWILLFGLQFLTKGRTVEDGVVEATAAVTGTSASRDNSRVGIGLYRTEDADCFATPRLTSKTIFGPADAFAYSPEAVSPVQLGKDASQVMTSVGAEVIDSYVQTVPRGLYRTLLLR